MTTESGDAVGRLADIGEGTDVSVEAAAVASDQHDAVGIGPDGRKKQIQVRVRDGAGFQERVIGSVDAVPPDGGATVHFCVVDRENDTADSVNPGAEPRVV